ncbi:portal protein [Sphingobium abikonense]|uniref:portal protein n=1 Tax=Sphingobium abikonense TaxID=86193 RepID=UPI003512DC73
MAVEAIEAEGPDLETFAAFLDGEETKADDAHIQDERANAIDFYNGEPYGDEEDGRSQVVTRDVAETVDHMTSEILRVMTSGERAVEFDIAEDGPAPEPEPGKPRPPTTAEIVTAAVTREFFQGQDGYQVLHDWIKAGLIEKTSTCKVCVEEQPPKRREAVVTPEELAMLPIEPVQAVEIGDGTFGIAWLEPQPVLFRDYVVPNEEFRVAQDARDLDDDCAYSGYLMPKTISQLREMGLDVPDDLAGNDVNGSDSDILRNARDRDRDTYWTSDRDGPNRRVWLREEYSRFDLNGDGVSELLKSFRVGHSILETEEVEEQPGVIWCPYPMPGRIIGQSLADKVMPTQRVASVVLRQTLDGFYLANKPRTYLSESAIGDTTIDDLLTPNIGSIIRYVGAAKPETHSSTFDMGSALALMEKLMGDKESITGITRLNQGIDADALNKTATGTAMMQAQGQLMTEYVARNFANAFARLMLKKYRLMRRFGSRMTVMVDGAMYETDPQQWPEDANVVVRVGLGSGRKDQRIAYRQMILGIAQQALQGGSRMFSDENLYNNVKGLIADMNLGPASQLITDPTTLPPEEEQEDPKLIEVKAKAHIEAAKVDQAARQAQAENMIKSQQAEYDLAAKREKAALDEQLARDKADFEADLALRQFEFESQLALRQQEFNERMAQKAHEAKEASAELPNKRPGGDLDK